jgi:hypothetical protein
MKLVQENHSQPFGILSKTIKSPPKYKQIVMYVGSRAFAPSLADESSKDAIEVGQE